MAELADAPDLGSGARKGVGVQVPLLALFKNITHSVKIMASRFQFIKQYS